MGRVVRQVFLVDSHCNQALGAVVALMQKEDTGGFVRTMDSITLAFKNATALSSRLLANLTMLRRDALLCGNHFFC